MAVDGAGCALIALDAWVAAWAAPYSNASGAGFAPAFCFHVWYSSIASEQVRSAVANHARSLVSARVGAGEGTVEDVSGVVVVVVGGVVVSEVVEVEVVGTVVEALVVGTVLTAGLGPLLPHPASMAMVASSVVERRTNVTAGGSHAQRSGEGRSEARVVVRA